MNSSSIATLARLATERFRALFWRHSMPNASHVRPKIARISADALQKWYLGYGEYLVPCLG